MTDTVLVVAGGSAPTRRAVEAIPPGARVVAADRGADHALALGLEIDLAIGDFDSATAAAVEAARTVERHAVDKDATDLELALRAALAYEPRRILVVGGIEGRLDHLLGELLILGADWLAGVEVDAVLGDALVHVVRGERVLTGTEGELDLPLRPERPGAWNHDRRTALPPARRDARARLQPRPLERLYRRRKRGSP